MNDSQENHQNCCHQKCHILKLKCTKFDFGWGSAPDPAGGAYSAPSDSLAGFKGPTSKGRGGDGTGRDGGERRAGEWVRKGEGREGRGGGRMGIDHPLFSA